jgi:thioredoxin-disulfide reductase
MDDNLPTKVTDVALPIPTENVGMRIIMFGLPTCPDCLRIKKFLTENAIEYEYRDVETDKEAAKWITSFVEFVPVLVMLDGTLMYHPSNAELLEKINEGSVNKTAREVEPHVFDTIIIGAGPSGITAAIYTVRKAVKTLVLTTEIGGQVIRSGDVENFPGFSMISGADLGEKFKADMERFKGDGMWIKEGIKVTGIEGEEGKFVVKTDQNLDYHSKTVIVASGRMPRYLGIPGEKELLGRGVATCATCDGPLFKGKEVVIIGGGNSALDAMSYMTKLAKSVTIVNVNPEVKGDQEFIDVAKAANNVTILNNTTALEIVGKDFVESVKVKDNGSGEEKSIPCSGVFIEIGWIPSVEFVPQLEKDELSQIKVDELGKTSVHGIWAAGDVNNLWGEQIIIAAGEGAKIALSVAEHINKIPHQATSNEHEG